MKSFGAIYRAMNKTAFDDSYWPPEWTGQACILIAWPARAASWKGRFDEARAAHARLAQILVRFQPVTVIADPAQRHEAEVACGPGIDILQLSVADGWIRDTGPVFVHTCGAYTGIDWGFYAERKPLAEFGADAALATRILAAFKIGRSDPGFVCEGGAVHTDGSGTILTTESCVLDSIRNPGVTKATAETVFRRYLGASRVVWLEDGLAGDETGGHVDELICPLAEGVLAFQNVSEDDAANAAVVRSNRARLVAAGFDLVDLPPAPIRHIGNWRVTLSYANVVWANGALIVPQFGTPEDARALAVYSKALPDRLIVPFEANDITAGGGGLHCVTLGVPV
ncbi:MAG: agmatine deiminase family protein [Pseudomonadota bacterium]|nr:agmatine deiminase family protein [Pseudomonadota bacterium]